ncbi:hypothetical protein Tco_1298626, partial [Tanacetum coccineum]
MKDIKNHLTRHIGLSTRGFMLNEDPDYLEVEEKEVQEVQSMGRDRAKKKVLSFVPSKSSIVALVLVDIIVDKWKNIKS